ncbi:MAG: hypothetical protein R6X34_23245 [Chloroflexota bacterium]|jgi:hypothetical protein
MILVRDEFQCKLDWGAQQAVERFKAMAHLLQSQDVIKRARILTDLSGRFETVIFEAEVESLDAYFAMLRTAFADPEISEAMGGMQFHSGSRAFYTIEATYELEG